MNHQTIHKLQLPPQTNIINHEPLHNHCHRVARQPLHHSQITIATTSNHFRPLSTTTLNRATPINTISLRQSHYSQATVTTTNKNININIIIINNNSNTNYQPLATVHYPPPPPPSYPPPPSPTSQYRASRPIFPLVAFTDPSCFWQDSLDLEMFKGKLLYIEVSESR